MTNDDEACMCRYYQCRPHPLVGNIVARASRPGCPVHGTFGAIGEAFREAFTGLGDLAPQPEQ